MRLHGMAAVALLGAFLLAAPAAAAPVDDSGPDPDACKLLSTLDLEPLLLSGAGGALDSASFHPAPGLATCRWDAHPRNRAADAVPLTATLAFYHFADPAHAQAQLDRQPHRDVRPSTAITGRGDDAVVRPTSTLVVARHGSDVTVINAAGAELADPQQPEARYLLDALALEAAGAEVKPPPWAKPAAKAKWAPIEGGPVANRAVEGWTPPPRAHPGAGVLEPFIHGLHVMSRMGFGILALAGPAAVLLFILGDRLARQGGPGDDMTSAPRRRWWPRWPTWIGGGLIALALGNSLLGAGLANALIDRYGEAGAATVTGTYATGAQYNRHDVVGNHVLIRTVDGRTVSAKFRTDDFNVRPAQNAVSYPGPGDVFTVDYLPHHPGDFVIRADDSSPWARRLACGRLDAWRAEAEQKLRFNPADTAAGAELGRAQAAETSAGCQTG